MTVKREIASCAVAAITRERDIDPTGIPSLLDAVFGWCVGAFYISNEPVGEGGSGATRQFG